MNAVSVSVVIPTRNRWHLLQTTLQSALDQDGIAHEVIVVDDGSTDETPRALERIDDPRLRVVRHDASRGVAPARNHGIAEARGAWLAFLDDDDLWSPDKLRKQIEVATERDAGFVYAGSVFVDEQRRVIWEAPAPDPEDMYSQLLEMNAIPAGCSNVVARTDLVRQLRGFDEQLFQLADWDMWLRLSAVAPAASVPDLLVGYVKHPTNMLTERDHDLLDELRYIEAKHGEDMRTAGQHLSNWIGLNHLMFGRRRDAFVAYARGALRYRAPGHVEKALRAAFWRNPYRDDRHLQGRDLPHPAWLDRYGDEGQ